VVTVIGILATLIVGGTFLAKNKAKDGRAEADLSQIRSVAATIYNDESGYSSMCNLTDNTLDETSATYPMLKIIEEGVFKTLNANPSCYASATEYCSQFTTTDNQYYCVDNSGIAKEFSTSTCSASSIKCQ
jgi:type II secretory pathway pseudopilin PulG